MQAAACTVFDVGVWRTRAWDVHVKGFFVGFDTIVSIGAARALRFACAGHGGSFISGGVCAGGTSLFVAAHTLSA